MLSKVIVIAVIAITSLPVRAAVVTSISTGANSLGIPLPAGVIDPRYQLISSPLANPPAGVYVVNAGPSTFPFPIWVANTATSKWIVPATNGAITDQPGGNYIYRTTFDLTGFNPATAQIQGQWAVDDDGLAINLNGVSTGIPIASAPNITTSFSPIVISTGFISGVNTLDFVTHNGNLTGGNPTGMQVQAIVTASVPEPSTALLLMTSSVLVATRRRRG